MIDWSFWLTPWIAAWALAATLMLLTWVYYLITKVPSCVDVSWGLGITIVGLFFLNQHGWHDKAVLMGLLLVAWGARLSGFLYWNRIRTKDIDPRYETLVSGWSKKSIGYFFNYQLQAVLLLFITIPFYAMLMSRQHSWFLTDPVAITLVVVGISGEWLADWQLLQYKKNPTGPVCRQGLWSWSRHPNYFFEWLTWLGFSLFVLPFTFGWLGLITPVALFIIMFFVTGPITERQSLKSRGKAYADYQNNTSMFFPWSPSKKS